MNCLNHYTTPWWCAADYTRTSGGCMLLPPIWSVNILLNQKYRRISNCIQYILFSSFRMLYTQSAVSLYTYPSVGMHNMQCACVVSLWQHGVLQTMLSYTDALMVSINMNGNCFIYIDEYIFVVLFCIENFSNCYRNVHLIFSHGYNLLKYIWVKLWVFIRGRGSFIPGFPLLTLREGSLQLGLRL